MMEATKRYEELGLAEALVRAYDYPSACYDLGLILRGAYGKLSKSLQSLVFRDTLTAFRLLPEVQTTGGLQSANQLLQAAEFAFPKQKKALAVSEFRHAVIAHKRRCRANQNGGTLQLPQDILVHIFQFLDIRSLVNASLVCWAWNAAANENALWQLQYSLFFGLHGYFGKNKQQTLSIEDEGPNTKSVWKEEFKREYMGNSSWRFRSHRAFCRHCKSIIWLSNITCGRSHRCVQLDYQHVGGRPLAPHKAVEYLLGQTSLDSSSSDSDSDSSDGSTSSRQLLPKLWAYPKFAGASDD